MYFSRVPYIFKKAISSLFCTVIDDENGIELKRISSDLTLKCYDHEHVFNILVIVLPVLCIFVIIIPIVLIILIKSQIKHEKRKELSYLYGYIINEYKV